MKNKIQIQQGERFGRLVVIREAESYNRHRYFLCKCDCGNEKSIPMDNLKRGRAKSCGCYKIELNITHNETKTRLYHIWHTMKQRCHYKKHINFSDYGGRGISVCKDWQCFEPFRYWALSNGYTDSLTIDRINVDGNYEPENCRWISMKEQQNNRRSNRLVTYKGETKTVQEWAEALGIKSTTLLYRLNQEDWGIEKAFTQKVNHYERH